MRRTASGSWTRAAALFALALAVCAAARAKDKLVDLPCDELYRQGKDLLARGDRGKARDHLRRFEQRCPREAQIAEVKLLIAASYFDEGQHDLRVEGVNVCRQVISFYPGSRSACECQLRLGQYHFRQMRPCDRDQSETHLAIEEYQRVITGYPDCELVDEARAEVEAARGRLACAELAVAEFYRKTGRHHAAEHRLDDLLRDYPRFPERCRALRLHVETLVKLGQGARAREQYARLGEDCAGEAEEMKKAEEAVGVPPPPRPAEAKGVR